jgi:hypothetical protein
MRTSASFQFQYLPHDVSWPLYDEVKLRYSNSPWTHRKLNTLFISATMRERTLLFSCSCKALVYETKNFISRLSWIPVLSVSRVEYLKFRKDVNLTTRKTAMVISVSSCFMAQETAEVCQVLQAGIIFIMQNHFVKKRENLLYSSHKKNVKLKIGFNFFV